MKTFKLIALDVLEEREDRIVINNIELLDGLIIDREDEKGGWVIECLMERRFKNYFTDLNKKKANLLLRTKITKESNQPAIFKGSIINVNEIEKDINVLILAELGE